MGKKREDSGDSHRKPLVGRDPLSRPEAPPELVALAKQLGQKIVHVSLARKPTADNPSLDGQSFLALVDFLPRTGDLIKTQDGKFCEVKNTLHIIRAFAPGGKTEAFGLFPTVFAILVEDDKTGG